MADKVEDLSKVEYASLLYDFYGSLLNENQSEVMELYHEDNLSLSEIAEQLGTTRQAVHYTLKKAEKALSGYEAKLGLVEFYKTRQRLTARLAELIDQSNLGIADKDEAAVLLEALAE